MVEERGSQIQALVDSLKSLGKWSETEAMIRDELINLVVGVAQDLHKLEAPVEQLTREVKELRQQQQDLMMKTKKD